MPIPPPIQSVAKPFFDFLFCISCIKVTNTLAPDAPIGWPNAIAPPLTFTLSGLKPSSLFTEIACAAKVLCYAYRVLDFLHGSYNNHQVILPQSRKQEGFRQALVQPLLLIVTLRNNWCYKCLLIVRCRTITS